MTRTWHTYHRTYTASAIGNQELAPRLVLPGSPSDMELLGMLQTAGLIALFNRALLATWTPGSRLRNPNRESRS